MIHLKSETAIHKKVILCSRQNDFPFHSSGPLHIATACPSIESATLGGPTPSCLPSAKLVGLHDGHKTTGSH